MQNHIQDIDQAKPSENCTLLNLLTKTNGSTSHVVTPNINSTKGVSTIFDDSSGRFPKCNKDSTFVEPTTTEKLLGCNIHQSLKWSAHLHNSKQSLMIQLTCE